MEELGGGEMGEVSFCGLSDSGFGKIGEGVLDLTGLELTGAEIKYLKDVVAGCKVELRLVVLRECLICEEEKRMVYIGDREWRCLWCGWIDWRRGGNSF